MRETSQTITRWVYAGGRCLAMLSIAKLRVGQEAYQLSGVAQSLDDYYTGAGEAHGQWLGGSAVRLGLTGRVGPDDLRAVLAGIRPGTGGLTPNGDAIRPHPRRVPGFDLTFKAPKSASVLYAVSDDPRVQGAVIEAGEAAMRSAIGWLEREAIRVQRGSHNQAYLARLDPAERAAAGPRRETTSGVVAASFRHRTSRASDPLLHWHVLVANLVEGADERWSAFAHPDLYRHARAAGEVFQAAFRAELTASLGVEWRLGRTVAEIAGIPQSILDQFSKRSAEIDAWLEATGNPDTPEGRQAAVLATRRHKPEVEGGRFDAAWKIEAEAAGWGPAHADGLIAACSRRSPVTYDDAWRLETVEFDEHGNPDFYERTVDADEWIADLLRRDLTVDRSTFNRADITRAVAARQGAGASVETIERLTNAVTASPHTVAVDDGNGPAQWTSRELADTEARFIDTISRPASATDRGVPNEVVEHILADRASLGTDQAAAVRRLSASTVPVSVLVGPAGTGKTYTIDSIAAVHRAAGIHVHGAAPSARAAIELSTATGMPTTTLHALLASWQRGHAEPSPGLLVIDEAGMTDIRTLTEVVTRHTDHGGRVLLAGDHHQLPEIGAGGGFAHAARNSPCVAELTINRRQHHRWEHAALTHLRNGDVAAAVTAYHDNDRITIATTNRDLVTTAVDHWAAARASGLNPILLAGTNELVDQLNHACIEHLLKHGDLDPHQPSPYGTTAFRPGERVVVRRNHTLDDNNYVANGHTGTITRIDNHALHITLDTGQHVALDPTYLRRGGHVTHAYALTTHRAQGGTWDLAIAVGADTLHREAAYVQLSRGTHTNQIILTDPEHTAITQALGSDTERHDHGLIPPDEHAADVDDHLVERLTRSAAKQLAHDIDPDLDIVDHLAGTVPLTELERRLQHAHHAEHLATTIHGTTRADLVERRARLDHNAHHLAVGDSVSPSDRNNVGVVTRVDDNGDVDVHFTSRSGHEADRTFGWDELRITGPHTSSPHPLTPAAQDTLDQALAALEDAITAFDRTLDASGCRPGDVRRYRNAVTHVIESNASELTAQQPSWLTHLVGPRPVDVAGAHTWDDTVRSIAAWRTRQRLDDDTLGLGTCPTDPALATQWTTLHQEVANARIWLSTTDRIVEAPVAASRTPQELHRRLDELDEIFDSAPDDVRHVIAELHTGQLSFDDTAELLQSVVDQRTARREWILEHWPHIVEHQEVTRVLITRSVAPTLPAASLSTEAATTDAGIEL